MTRGQDSLVIDAAEASAGVRHDAGADLRAYALPVLHATAAELAEHAAVLADIDQSSGGKAVWRAASTPEAMA
jgi:DNA polymerase-3 subunit epsilon